MTVAGDGNAFQRLEEFRNHAKTMVGDPQRLAEEYMDAKRHAEGIPGYKSRITEHTANVRYLYCKYLTWNDLRILLSMR